MNWGEFFAMRGYALYVWGSYAALLLLVVVDVATVRWRRQRVAAVAAEAALMKNLEAEVKEGNV